MFSQHVNLYLLLHVITFIIYVEITIGRLDCGSYGDGSSYKSCNNIGGGKHIWRTIMLDHNIPQVSVTADSILLEGSII